MSAIQSSEQLQNGHSDTVHARVVKVDFIEFDQVLGIGDAWLDEAEPQEIISGGQGEMPDAEAGKAREAGAIESTVLSSAPVPMDSPTFGGIQTDFATDTS